MPFVEIPTPNGLVLQEQNEVFCYGKTTAQLAAAPTSVDLALGRGALFYDATLPASSGVQYYSAATGSFAPISSAFSAAVQATLTAVFSASLALAVPTGADDAAATNAQIVAAGALAQTVLPTGQYMEVRPQVGKTYLLNTALEPVSGVHFNATGSYWKKNANSGAPAANSIWRTYDVATPITGANAFTITFTAIPTAGATSATLTAPWAGASGAPVIIFANGDVRNVIVTNGSTAVAWTTGLSAAAGLTVTGTGGTYYGRYKNFRLTGGVWDSNGFSDSAQIMRFENVEDCVFVDVVVKHSSGQANWAWQFGGNRNKVLNCSVLGGTDTFQDAFHWGHGADNVMVGCYSEGGDDGIAGGIDTAAIETFDDEGLTNLTITGCVTKSAKATAIKLYYGVRTDGQPMAGRRGTVDNIIMQAITGVGGLVSNGGIYIVDTTKQTFTAGVANGASGATLTAPYMGPTSSSIYIIFDDGQVRQATFTFLSTAVTFATNKSGAAGAIVQQVDPTRISNVTIDANLKVGSAASDGATSFGIFVQGATNVNIRGTITLTDTANGIGVWGASINLFDGVDLQVNYPRFSARSTAGGIAFFNGRDARVHHCKLVGNGSGRGQIEQTGVLNLQIDHVTGIDLGNTGAHLIAQSVGAGIFNNTWAMDSCSLRKLAGATTSRAYIQQSGIQGSGFVTHGRMTNCDLRGQANATAIDQAYSTPVFGVLTFTAAPLAGATSATLNANWAGTTGTYNVIFGTSYEAKVVTLTNGSTNATFSALANNAGTATATYTGGFLPDQFDLVGNRGNCPNSNVLGNVPLGFAASQSVPLLNSNGNRFQTTATANTAIQAPTGGVPGARYQLLTRMGGAGGYTRSYDAAYVGTSAALPSGAGGTTGQQLLEEYEMMPDAYHWRLVSPAVWV